MHLACFFLASFSRISLADNWREVLQTDWAHYVLEASTVNQFNLHMLGVGSKCMLDT